MILKILKKLDRCSRIQQEKKDYDLLKYNSTDRIYLSKKVIKQITKLDVLAIYFYHS